MYKLNIVLDKGFSGSLDVERTKAVVSVRLFPTAQAVYYIGCVDKNPSEHHDDGESDDRVAVNYDVRNMIAISS